MTPEMVPIFLTAIIIGFGLIFLLVRRSIRKRRIDGIIRGANRSNLLPAADPDAAFGRFCKQDFLLFSKVQNPVGGRLKYFLEGTVGELQVSLFDYEVIHLHESNTLQSIMVAKGDRVKFPRFALIPTKLKKERFTQRLRTAPLEFTSRLVSQYRKTQLTIEGYNLSCPSEDEQTVKDLFNGELTAYFAARRKFTVEGLDESLLIYRRESVVSQIDMQRFIEEGISIHGLFAKSILSGATDQKRSDRNAGASPAA